MSDLLAIRAQSVLATVSIFDMLRELNGGHDLHGDGTQQIRCPIHADRTPSARIYAPEGDKPGKIWCFTCARNFDAIDLVQAKFGYPYPMAVEWLEARFGVPSPTADLTTKIAVSLYRAGPAPLAPSFTFVEASVLAARSRMGQQAFSKALVALDWVAYQYKKGALDYSAVTQALKKILRTTEDHA